MISTPGPTDTSAPQAPPPHGPERAAPSPTHPREPGATAKQPPSLALYGGPRAASETCRERWKTIGLPAVWRIARYALKGRNTITRGDCLAELEQRFANLTDTTYAIAMNSGTSALYSAYYAAGVKPGDEVIVPTYTFYASAAPVLHLGGLPVFCDIDARTLTADPDDVERRITPRTRAICVVHLWGNPARMERFVRIARRHNLVLIEDCSHAHGATYQGRPVGSWGDIGCFSMQGHKAVSGGELGMAVTDDPVLYDHMLAIGQFGRVGVDQQAATYDIDQLSLGFKFRPHPYAVLLALDSLARLDRLNELRRRNHAILAAALDGCRTLDPIGTYTGSVRGGFLEFLFKFHPDRAGGVSAGMFAAAAAAEGVPMVRDRYTLMGERGRLLHELPLFAQLDYARCGGCMAGGRNPYRDDPSRRPTLPIAEELAGRLLSLPAFADVDPRYVHEIGRALRKVADTLPTITDYRLGA